MTHLGLSKDFLIDTCVCQVTFFNITITIIYDRNHISFKKCQNHDDHHHLKYETCTGRKQDLTASRALLAVIDASYYHHFDYDYYYDYYYYY